MTTANSRDHELTTLQISGMTCAACATRIEKGLNKLPGISKATVNLAMETANIEFSPSEISIDDMQRKVKQLGYEAVVKQDQKAARIVARKRSKGKSVSCYSQPRCHYRCFGAWSDIFNLLPGCMCQNCL